MADEGGWCLIESDPGVFTELISNIGVKGVQVEEIYSLDPETLYDLDPVYGLVFLFKWHKPDDSTLPYDTNPPPGVFFAHQIIQNACATQAILNIVMNVPGLDLGDELKEFKSFSAEFDSEMKGLAISNSERIRAEHNNFARSSPFVNEGPQQDDEKEDVFHFTAFLPINGHVYELDGLKRHPVKYGECTPANWLSVATPIIQERIAKYSGSEIRFNLMAVIKSRTLVYQEAIKKLQKELTATEQLLLKNPSEQLQGTKKAKLNHIANYSKQIAFEQDKLAKYRKENARRKHNYIPFIMKLLSQMAEKDLLSALVQ